MLQSRYRATTILIAANVACFLAQQGLGDMTIAPLALWPLDNGFMPWQVVSYAFLHGSVAHLFFNMFGLWMFGRELEIELGSRTFLLLYFASVLSAALMQILVSLVMGSAYPTIGASGGVFGVLLAFGMFFPKRIIVLLIPPIPMPARVFVALYACIELFMGLTGTESDVAHFAHLGGMIGAYLLICFLRRRHFQA